ncbi:MAG: sigma-70 family RNA polymerase sigma factor [Planctomycetota bacterium]
MVTTKQSRLVERARSGCRQAFGRLWSEHEGAVRAVVVRAAPACLVEDVVQDVAVAALVGIASFRSESEFAGWVTAIARHRAVSAREVWRRHRERQGLVGEVEACVADDRVSERRELRRDLGALLRRLPPACRRLLWLHHGFGRSAPELAAHLGTTQGTVRVALCRGLRRLREIVALRAPA